MITLKEDGARRTAKQPYSTAQFVNVGTACDCGSFSVRGNGQNRQQTQYAEEEDAVCVSCFEPRGRLHVKLETLFGRDEDNRVLNGRCRVY